MPDKKPPRIVGGEWNLDEEIDWLHPPPRLKFPPKWLVGLVAAMVGVLTMCLWYLYDMCSDLGPTCGGTFVP